MKAKICMHTSEPFFTLSAISSWFFAFLSPEAVIVSKGLCVDMLMLMLYALSAFISALKRLNDHFVTRCYQENGFLEPCFY